MNRNTEQEEAIINEGILAIVAELGIPITITPHADRPGFCITTHSPDWIDDIFDDRINQFLVAKGLSRLP